jgi:DNA polymerase-1
VARSFYIIDGHAQIFRAYYAPFPNLTAPSGEPTRATHVFCQTLVSLVRNRKPDFLAVALDVSDETVFRKDIYAEYKAHREPPPEDFGPQADRIVAILEALRIPLLRVPTFEADDIMATLARRMAGPDLHIFFVSKDKDLDQLLSEHVSLYDPGKDEVITADRLMQIKGWTPSQAIDAQTLIGDSVDNVPGVQGIGPKTAAKLLQKYGTAQAVVEHADELTPKQRENVRAFAPSMHVTRQLVTLRDDAPVELDLQAAEVGRIDWAAVRPMLRELGMRRTLEQWPGDAVAAGGAARVPERLAPSEAGTEGLKDRGMEGSKEEPLAAESVVVEARTADSPALRLGSPDGGKYELVNTPEALARVAGELSRRPAFALDTETTGVNPIDAELVGISLAWVSGSGVYIPVRSMYGQPLALELVRERLGPVLADATSLKVGHHLKYDLIVLRQARFTVAGPLFDTMIAAFVLDPLRTSYKLDNLASALLGHQMIPITDLIGKGRDQLPMDQVPLEQVAEYAAEDADYTWQLKELFEPQLASDDRQRLFYEVEMPLVGVLLEIEYNGVTLDVPFLQDMGRRLAARLDELTQAAHAAAGQPFNLDSPKQLSELLFDKLGFRVVRKTKTARSTDAETLETIAAETDHALPKLLLEYRELQKLRSTYVEALPKAVSRRTGRVHTSYHQTGAITGRLSSSEPNLQNIPVRTELGREIRRAFIPRSSAERLIMADYSQVELRVLAHFCRDPALMRAFAEDQDIHAVVAAQVNGVSVDQVTREMRSRAKAVNFGIIYGQTAFGLAQTTGMSRTEAQKFIDDYFARYPLIRAFIDQCIEDARRDGFVRTILGRRRPIVDIDSKNRVARALAERLSVNTVIQGSAADLIKMAMIRLHRRIAGDKLPLRMLLQVHDELVFEAPADRAADLSELIRDEMSRAIELRVPLKVDVHAGQNWLEAK